MADPSGPFRKNQNWNRSTKVYLKSIKFQGLRDAHPGGADTGAIIQMLVLKISLTCL
jgi:hypothetical protein